MKAIMISIKPERVEKILNGDKTIEIRKTMPKCKLPVKVYIYCTKDKKYEIAPFRFVERWKYKKFDDNTHYCCGCTANMGECMNGKVVAEFTLNKIETLWQNNKDGTSTAHIVDKDEFEKQTCLTWEHYCEYHKCKNGKYPNSFAWHIDDLKIYDELKELGEFKTTPYCFNGKNIEFKENAFGEFVPQYHDNSFCKVCKYYDGDWGDCNKGFKPLTRPPQSWCYVEE